MTLPSFANFALQAKLKGYTIFNSKNDKDFNLNIVGWRNKNSRVNYFDDYISVYWQEKDEWQTVSYKATTLPGLPSLLKPSNPKGSAILAPGQYHEAYQLGDYKGYKALKQVRPVKVFRDSNLDKSFDFENPEFGLFGIHIHKAGLWNSLVGPYSAGCQVFKNTYEYEAFIKICEVSSVFWGNRFTYTLLELQ